MAKWTTADIPPQQGRTAVVTGPGGLGFENALALARSGANVILAGRHPAKGEAAVARIREAVPGAEVTYGMLDLASLASIEAFAARLRDSIDGLDLLINNAAVMSPPTRLTTADGFELQLGTNYLGHFALTGRLLPVLRRGKDARVVSVSSVAARSGAIRFDDLQAERGYAPMPTYAQSKLACLMFALELQRRADAAGWGIRSMGAHPGISRTDLIPNGFGPRSPAGLVRRLFWFLFQPAAQGALPTLFAATAGEARGGAYYGPDRMSEVRGFPAEAKVPSQARDRQAAERLWSESERLTGTVYA